jgi:DNA-binding protein
MSRDRNTIYIGRKPVMSYVLAVITHFNASDVQEATLKARGRAITTAVDIEIGTEVMPEEGGRSRAVSTIAVKLALAEQATS